MDIFQQLEQMGAMLRDISPVLWSYYTDLKSQGFTDEQAIELVKGLQDKLFR